MTQNMTKGNPWKLIFLFSLPLFVGNMFQQLYSMVDTLIVGRTLGYQALAAVGVTGGISFLVIGFVQGFTAGFSIPVAQRFGADDLEELRREVTTAILLSTVLTIILTAGSVWGVPYLLELMQTPEDIIEMSYDYIVVIFWGIAATTFYNLISNIIRALGDSKTPLVFLILASALNIVLDLVFILNFHMGVAGAGWATVASQAVSGLLCLVFVIKKFPVLHLKRKDWKITKQHVRRHLSLGLPMSFQFSITAIGVIILQSVLNGFGSETIAGFTAASKAEQLSTQFFLALGSAMATYSAQNFGAGRIDRVRTGAKAGTVITLAFSVIGALTLLFLGRPLSMLFVDAPTPEILDSSQTYLTTIAWFYPALSLIFVFRNLLQGIGKGFVPLMAGVSELVMRAVVSLILARLIGYIGVCLASPIAWIGAAVPLIFAYLWHCRRTLRLAEQTESHPTAVSE